jgi:hypothetical protein
MYEDERAIELVNRAERLGLHLQFESGMNVVKYAPGGDANGQIEILAALARNIVAVRRLIQKRAIGARGKKLLGARIWDEERGEGTLTRAEEDGSLTISFEKIPGLQSARSVSASGDSLLVLVEDDVADPAVAETTPEKSKKGILERLRGA